MGQPTQEPPPVYTTRGHNTPPQASACDPFGTRLSFSALDDVQCHRADRARQPGATTTNYSRVHAYPDAQRGLTMYELPETRREGRPEIRIS